MFVRFVLFAMQRKNELDHFLVRIKKIFICMPFY